MHRGARLMSALPRRARAPLLRRAAPTATATTSPTTTTGTTTPAAGARRGRPRLSEVRDTHQKLNPSIFIIYTDQRPGTAVASFRVSTDPISINPLYHSLTIDKQKGVY